METENLALQELKYIQPKNWWKDTDTGNQVPYAEWDTLGNLKGVLDVSEKCTKLVSVELGTIDSFDLLNGYSSLQGTVCACNLNICVNNC